MGFFDNVADAFQGVGNDLAGAAKQIEKGGNVPIKLIPNVSKNTIPVIKQVDNTFNAFANSQEIQSISTTLNNANTMNTFSNIGTTIGSSLENTITNVGTTLETNLTNGVDTVFGGLLSITPDMGKILNKNPPKTQQGVDNSGYFYILLAAIGGGLFMYYS